MPRLVTFVEPKKHSVVRTMADCAREIGASANLLTKLKGRGLVAPRADGKWDTRQICRKLDAYNLSRRVSGNGSLELDLGAPPAAAAPTGEPTAARAELPREILVEAARIRNETELEKLRKLQIANDRAERVLVPMEEVNLGFAAFAARVKEAGEQMKREGMIEAHEILQDVLADSDRAFEEQFSERGAARNTDAAEV